MKFNSNHSLSPSNIIINKHSKQVHIKTQANKSEQSSLHLLLHKRACSNHLPFHIKHWLHSAADQIMNLLSESFAGVRKTKIE